MLACFRIAGNSMAPTLPNGSLVLALRFPRALLRIGMRVVVETREGPVIVKRLRDVTETGLVLASDNPFTTSRFCGGLVDVKKVYALLPLQRSA